MLKIIVVGDVLVDSPIKEINEANHLDFNKCPSVKCGEIIFVLETYKNHYLGPFGQKRCDVVKILTLTGHIGYLLISDETLKDA